MNQVALSFSPSHDRIVEAARKAAAFVTGRKVRTRKFYSLDDVSAGDYLPLGSLRHGRQEYMLTRDIPFELNQRGSGVVVIVPAGFVVDGYSLPGLLQSWQPKRIEHLAASTIHDWLYEVGKINRWMADRILLEAMRCQGVARRHKWPAYLGVRLFGWKGFGEVSEYNVALIEEARAGGIRNWIATRETRYAEARARADKIRIANGMGPA